MIMFKCMATLEIIRNFHLVSIKAEQFMNLGHSRNDKLCLKAIKSEHYRRSRNDKGFVRVHKTRSACTMRYLL